MSAQRRADAIRTAPVLPILEEVVMLAAEYFVRLSIPEKAHTDSVHLAVAAWHAVDYLVTWNCTHTATPRVRRLLDEINRDHGIRTPGFCTPEELMEP